MEMNKESLIKEIALKEKNLKYLEMKADGERHHSSMVDPEELLIIVRTEIREMRNELNKLEEDD